jgi:hypothetical protein
MSSSSSLASVLASLFHEVHFMVGRIPSTPMDNKSDLTYKKTGFDIERDGKKLETVGVTQKH